MSKVFRLLRWRWMRPEIHESRRTVATMGSDTDPLLVFSPEDAQADADSSSGGAANGRLKPRAQPDAQLNVGARVPRPAWATAVVAVGAIAGGLMWAYTPRLPLTAAEPRPAKLTIETHPAGASVAIDGQDRGLAPLSVTLPSGAHTATLRHQTEERVLPLMLAAGAEVTHHIEFVTHETVAAATGGISIVTDPPGARVQIDGRQRGLSPLMLTGLAPAEYKVAVSSETGSAGRTISVKPGASASVVFSLPKVSTPLAGWLAVAAPFDVQVLEDGNVVGSGRSSKIMLAAGRHTVALVNESLRYQDVRTIEVTPGRTTPLQVDAPKVAINANARPWADVFIDGSSVGQTPISNVSVTIGTHEIVFRHPQLGERRQTIVVTTQGPNRISLDLTK